MRILVIRLSALGDVVTATPVSRIIKQADPGGELVWAVEERCADVLRGNPYIDQLLVLPTSKSWGQWLGSGRLDKAFAAHHKLRRGLRDRRFDAVVDLQGLFKSALLAGVARSRRKLMPDDATERFPWLFTTVAPRRTEAWHTSTMYVSMLEPLGIRPRGPADYRMIMPVSDTAAERMAGWLTEQGLAPGGYFAICPGTTRSRRCGRRSIGRRCWPGCMPSMACRR
jgi:heptosyltransferase I